MPQESAFQFMESQAAHIESRVRVIQHGTIQYAALVFISREASPHADSIVYYSADSVGEMIDLSNRATDLPLVQVTKQQLSVPIRHKALAYDWSDLEIGRAQYVGENLSDMKVRASFRIAEEEKERVFLNGDAAVGWDGLLENAAIPTEASAGSWETATDTTIFGEINELIGARWEHTEAVRIPDTLLLPLAALYRLNRPMGNDASRSVREYVMQNNPYTAATGQPLMIRPLRQFKSVNSTTRALAYPRSADVIRYHIPQELTFIDPQRVGMGWVYYGWMSLGGLEIMEPTAMGYLTGL